MLEADQGSPKRQAHDKGAGAVDRVQGPEEVRALPCVPEFLASDAVFRELARYNVAHDLFSPSIRDCNGIEIASSFVIGCVMGAKMPQRDHTRGICEVMSRFQQSLE